MAPTCSQLLLPLLLLLLLLLSSPAASSAACHSHKFATPGKSFASCADLPHLSASLHYTFDPAASTLSMAFTAPPSKPSGWVAWAINPTAAGMAGSQALLAYKSPNGSVAVSTLSIASYSSLTPGPLSLKVSHISGESSSTSLTLFATWHLPPKLAASFNHVWQVGPSVANGVPAKHDFAQSNLLSKSKLQLSSAPAEAPSAASPSSPSSPPANATAAAAPAPTSGKNAAGEGAVLMGRFGACLAVAVCGLLF